MHSILLALLTTGIVHTGYASNEYIAPRATTSGPGFAGEKRADPTAKVTLGPQSGYFVSLAANAAKPTGDKFTIVPAGDKASDGVNLILGPDLITKVDNARKEKCGDPKSDDCHNAILDLLPVDQVDLQKRQVGLLASIGVGLRYLIGAIVVAFGAHKIEQALHAPQSNLDQAATPTPASVYEVVPSANASPTTYTVQSSDKAPEPTPFIGAGDGQGFSINAQKDLVDRTNDLAGMVSGNCPAPHSKRDMVLEKRLDPPDAAAVACLLALTVQLVRNIAQGPLAEWVRVNRNNRDIAPQGAGAALVLANAENQVANIRDQVGLQQEQFQAMVRVAYWQAYNRIVRLQFEQPVTKVTEEDILMKYCPPKDITKCSDDHCKGSNGKCADDSDLKGCECGDKGESDSCPVQKVACTNCGGSQFSLFSALTGDRCKGVQGKLKGCACWPVPDRGSGFFKSKDDLAAVQKALLGLKDLPDNPPPPDDGGQFPPAHCELRKRDASTGIVNIETPFFSSLVKTVCKDYPGDISASFDKTLTAKDAADDQYKNEFQGMNVQFIWEDKPDKCDWTKCEDIYNQFTHGACSADHHSMHDHGELDLECGTAKYKISTSAPTSTTPPASSTTQACATGAFNPPDWVIPRDDLIKAANAYCDHTVDSQNHGAKVANNWPGSCAWVFDNDVKKMSAGFIGSNMCDGTTPTVDGDSCKSSFQQAIDNCDTAQPAPNNKRSGTHGEKCMKWSFHVAPYANAGYPCIGTYNGPDKPPITKRAGLPRAPAATMVAA